MVKYLTLFLILFSITTNCYSQVVLNNSNCRNAYEDILSLKFKDARIKIQSEKKSNPNNVFIDYLENYIDFLTVTISEDENIFDSIEDAIQIRTNRIKKLDDTCRYKKYFLGNINLQWATVDLRFRNYATGAIEINRSYRLLIDNEKNFPQFFPNVITLGVLHVIIGIVPDSYNWLLSLVSMSGSVEQGRDELQLALRKCSSTPHFKFLQNEILFYLGMIDLNLSPDPEFASNLITKIENINHESLLLSYLSINAMMKNGKNEYALRQFDSIDSSIEYYPFYYLNYLQGECQLRKLNTTEAKKNYLVFTSNFSGTNYVKDAWRKIGWCSLIEGDTTSYLKALKHLLELGELNIDADKNAQEVALKEIIPSVDLIKARLLSDGGYYHMADSVLYSLSDESLSTLQIVEKNYRLGRIAHQTKDYEKAKKYYMITIDKGRVLPQYFAANSALKLGNIYELLNESDNAKVYYELCLDMDFEEYKNSIRGKAKQGLERVTDN